ncbi:MAG: ComEC/Rec2 family competence protein, partial [Herbaspirillum sp.]
MRAAILGFAVGILVLQNQMALPSWLQIGCLFLVVLCLALLLRRVQRLRLRVPLITLAGALLGFIWATAFAQYQLTQQLPTEWEGRDVTLIGTVDSLPQPFEQGVRFYFAVEQIVPQSGVPLPPSNFPSRLSLSWYRGFAEVAEPIVREKPSVEAGQRWRLTVRLKRPHGNSNPHGFDYEVWLLEQGLRATGYVRPAAEGSAPNQLLDSFVPSFSNLVERGRSHLRQRILNALPDHEYAGVITALVIGDQRAIN